jgi:hypothetical protein
MKNDFCLGNNNNNNNNNNSNNDVNQFCSPANVVMQKAKRITLIITSKTDFLLMSEKIFFVFEPENRKLTLFTRSYSF